MELPLVFDRYRAEIDAELRSALAKHQSPMYDMVRYHLGWIDEKGYPRQNSVGKALRPTLCLLACEATGGDWHKALPAAAAIELVHNFSLVQDDIQDNDPERHHRPTVWSIWGKPQAINAGTAMHVLASLTLLHLRERGISAEKQRRAQYLLNESCLRMMEGQYLDISYESRLDIGVSDYLDMIDKKTAALIGCSLETGALLGNDDESVVRAFRNLGRDMGIAFQIRDDILGIWGDEKETGKLLAGDIQRRKKSLPIVYALEKAEGEMRGELVKVYQDQVVDPEGVATVLRILEAVEAQLYAQGVAEEYRDRALAEIERIVHLPWARDSLEELAHFVVKRKF